MARQRARCRNPDCGTYVVHDQQSHLNDATFTGLCQGVMLTLTFVVVLVTLGLGALALTTSFTWALGLWVASGLSLFVIHIVEQRLDSYATVRYHYTCMLCGKVWGDVQAPAATSPSGDHDIMAA